jgi:hypothetical protein
VHAKGTPHPAHPPRPSCSRSVPTPTPTPALTRRSQFCSFPKFDADPKPRLGQKPKHLPGGGERTYFLAGMRHDPRFQSLLAEIRAPLDSLRTLVPALPF